MRPALTPIETSVGESTARRTGQRNVNADRLECLYSLGADLVKGIDILCIREPGQLYAAWRKGSSAVRKRILDDPELFFKTQQQAQERAPAGTGAELLRDLEMVVAIVNRAQRRLAGAAATEQVWVTFRNAHKTG
jgi:hypothetical protein